MTPDFSFTPVIVRWWKSELLALFPTLPATPDPEICMSYMRVGQHGGAHYKNAIQKSRAATWDEARPITDELQNIGYNLSWHTRATRAMVNERRKALGLEPVPPRLAYCQGCDLEMLYSTWKRNKGLCPHCVAAAN